jgi:glutamyl-tRNA reductase
MEIAVIGLNHITAPAEIREKAAFTDVKKIEALNLLLDKGIEEIVLLSTCNRSEVYIACAKERLERNIEIVKQLYNSFLKVENIDRYVYEKQGKDSAYHLYRVASGLDSIVIGEDQILGQVKAAHAFSMNLGTTKKTLNRLFREAVSTSKKIKTELKISENKLSVSSIGVRFIKEKLGSYEGKNIFIIGLGEMGRLALNYILEEPVGKIYMANRNHQKVVDISKEFPQVIPVDYKDRYEVLKDTDVLITATSSPHTLIKSENLGERESELFIMDLAIPRDVDLNVGDISNVHLYNVDNLKTISAFNERTREELAEAAKGIIKSDIEDFINWLSSSKVDPVIKSLKEKCEIIEADTLAYISRRIELDKRDAKIIEKMLESALKRLLREPILKLKAIEDNSKRELYIDVLEDLFDINFE